jgi:hypothetical protein
LKQVKRQESELGFKKRECIQGSDNMLITDFVQSNRNSGKYKDICVMQVFLNSFLLATRMTQILQANLLTLYMT